MNKIFLAGILGLIFGGAGCVSTQALDTPSTDRSQVAGEEKDKGTEDVYKREAPSFETGVGFRYSGFQFTLPRRGWQITKLAWDHVAVQTSSQPHRTSFSFKASTSKKEIDAVWASVEQAVKDQVPPRGGYIKHLVSEKEFDVWSIDYDCGECYSPPQYLLRTKDRTVLMSVLPSSDEKYPEDYDGIWWPSYNFTDEELDALAASAKPL